MTGPFRHSASRGAQCLVEPSLEAAIRELGLLAPGAALRALRRSADEGGRAPVAVVALPGRAERIHLRPVLHGGVASALWGGRIAGMARPIAELGVLKQLRSCGVPVPRPVLVSGQRAGCLWRAVIGTIYEEDTRDGADLLAESPDAARVHAAACAAGRAIRYLHDAGCRHPDLQIRNLLFREKSSGFEVVVVDLDRARISGAVSPKRRMAELMRLYRSLRKRGLLSAVGPAGCAACLESYTSGDRELRRAMLSRLPLERARVALHALAYPRR